jgi:GNAT superfamily N-acetyltransferase
MSTIIIKQVSVHDELYRQVWQLREDILRQPLGLSLKDEDLGGDAADTIFAAVQQEKLIGCVMMHTIDEDYVKLRQMAVLPDAQGLGVGRMLVEAAGNWARENGFKEIVMHARITAAGFYEKLGYHVRGAEFTEVNIPHIVMYKSV